MQNGARMQTLQLKGLMQQETLCPPLLLGNVATMQTSEFKFGQQRALKREFLSN